MADNRKTLESIPVPATGAAPDPLTNASPGADMGGIPRTADSALGESIGLTGDLPAIGPNVSADTGGAGQGGERRGSATGTVADASTAEAQDDARRDAETPEDESALESLGKAIAAPLSGEAMAREPRR